MDVSPVDTVYQFIVLPADMAERFVLVPLQIEVPVPGVTEVGAPGVTGCVLTTALLEADEVHPDDDKVTVKVYVLAAKPEKLAVEVDPVMVAPPGFAVTVQAEVGKSLNATIPVAVAQVG